MRAAPIYGYGARTKLTHGSYFWTPYAFQLMQTIGQTEEFLKMPNLIIVSSWMLTHSYRLGTSSSSSPPAEGGHVIHVAPMHAA